FPLRSFSKSLMPRPSIPALPLFALTLLNAVMTTCFGMLNGLLSFIESSCWSVVLCFELNDGAPSLHCHYSNFMTNTSASAPASRFAIATSSFCDLCLFTCHRDAGSCVPHQSLICTHAALIPFAEQSASKSTSALVPA